MMIRFSLLGERSKVSPLNPLRDAVLGERGRSACRRRSWAGPWPHNRERAFIDSGSPVECAETSGSSRDI